MVWKIVWLHLNIVLPQTLTPEVKCQQVFLQSGSSANIWRSPPMLGQNINLWVKFSGFVKHKFAIISEAFSNVSIELFV